MALYRQGLLSLCILWLSQGHLALTNGNGYEALPTAYPPIDSALEPWSQMSGLTKQGGMIGTARGLGLLLVHIGKSALTEKL